MNRRNMNRRVLLTLIGGAAAWPVAVKAQQQAGRMRRVGMLVAGASDDPRIQNRVGALIQGLQETGWLVGRNVQIDARYGAGDDERLRAMAAELIALSPDVIMAVSGPAVRALRAKDVTVPVVFVSVIDPVGSGYVASLSRPGGNYTGLASIEYGIAGKWLQLLKQVAPNVTRIAVMRDKRLSREIGFSAVEKKIDKLINRQIALEDSILSTRATTRRSDFAAKRAVYNHDCRSGVGGNDPDGPSGQQILRDVQRLIDHPEQLTQLAQSAA